MNCDANVLLVGIDDTDNLTSRGTGFRARQLARGLQTQGLAAMLAITRHQLLVDPRIPYTSHNSSACLRVAPRAAQADIHAYCREYLLDSAADGSDVGLCLASVAAGTTVIPFGESAQRDVLDQDAARRAAAAAGIHLEGLTGTRGGIIGALAGVGLHCQGNDGRYLWVRRIRELDERVMSIGELLAETGIEGVRDLAGRDLGGEHAATIELGRWARPVRMNGQAILLVERNEEDGSADYIVAAKDHIKAFNATPA